MTCDGLRVDFERQQGLFCKKDGADRFLSSFDFGLAGPGLWDADWTAQSAGESEERDAGRAAVTGRAAGGKSVRVLGCGGVPTRKLGRLRVGRHTTEGGSAPLVCRPRPSRRVSCVWSVGPGGLTGFVKARVTGVDSRRRAHQDMAKPAA